MKECPSHQPSNYDNEYDGESTAHHFESIPVSSELKIIGLRPPAIDLKTSNEIRPGNFDEPAVAAQLIKVANDPEHMLARLEEANESGERHTRLKWVLGGAVFLTTIGTAAYFEQQQGWKHISEFRKKAFEISEKLHPDNK